MNFTSFSRLLPGYHSLTEIYRDPKTIVLRALCTNQGTTQPVVIKLLAASSSTDQELLKFRHHYTITKDLKLPGIVQTYSSAEDGQHYALVMEDFRGISLAEYSQTQALSLSDILKIAIQIADILHDLGQEKIVHQDIKPANLLIHPVTKQVKLIDFSIAAILPGTTAATRPDLSAGTPAYFSPEQTGRIQRGIDCRSDFYALGVTLYELLTGQLPFGVAALWELIHCHLSQIATPAHLVNATLPIAISELVAKLMAKNAEDRYQSALGLKQDLEHGLRQWLGAITPAAIAPDNAQIYQELQESAANARLQQSYLAALLNNIPHVAWLKDQNSQFISVNQSFADLAGSHPEAIIGKNDQDIWPLDLAQKYLDDDQLVITTGQRQVVEESVLNSRGEERWLETIKTPIRNSDGLITGTVGIALDITDRKQAQLDLHRTNHSLALSNAQLQRATQLKDEFLATMSHELRTPLNAILGMSEVLQEEIFGELNARQLKSINTIKRSGQHLLSLINDILDVSKISAGKLELDLTTMTIEQLCQSSLVFVKQQAFEKQIQLELQLPKKVISVVVDDRRMCQVLINLLSNAVKFTPAGGRVVLAVTVVTATMAANGIGAATGPETGSETGLEIAILDTGIGIARADQGKLFQPFVQLDSSLNRQQEGTGLGLILVKQIVELHGGTVQLQSELGQGSCFTVKLPITCVMAPPAMALDQGELVPLDRTESTAIPRSGALTSPAVILLAEDNESNIHTFSSYLTAKGYQLLLAANGWQAIELAQQAQPDLILMDIQMPGLDGIAAIKYLRQLSTWSQRPIIALTALAMAGDREKCLAAGADSYLAKPVKPKELHQMIQQHLKVIKK